MEERIKMILPIEYMQRIVFKTNDYMIIDVHGLTVKSMSWFLRTIACICREGFTMRVIHGFNHGTKLKDAIREDKLISRDHRIIPDITNPGVTLIVCS